MGESDENEIAKDTVHSITAYQVWISMQYEAYQRDINLGGAQKLLAR